MSSQFEFLGPFHLAAIVAMFAVPVLLTFVVKRLHSAKATRAVCGAFTGVLLLNDILPGVQRLVLIGPHEFARWYLPLHVCSIAVFAVAAALVFRWQTAYEIAYFWGLAGATNAVVTPPPVADYLQYFIAHGGIVAGALFATWGLGMRPTNRSVLRVFALLNCLALVAFGVNWALDSNYMFLSRPPATESPFFFAPWPWYILILDGVALGLFYLLLLPFKIGRNDEDSP